MYGLAEKEDMFSVYPDGNFVTIVTFVKRTNNNGPEPYTYY